MTSPAAAPAGTPAPPSFSDDLLSSAPAATELNLRMQPEVTTAADPERTAGASLFGKEPGSANYRLNLAIRPEDLTFDAGPDGKARVALEFAAVLYDSRGKILDSHQDRATVALDPDRLRSIQASSLRVHSTVTLPASGDIAVRLLVRDLPSGRIGTLQVSAAAIRAAAVPVP